MFYDQDRGKKKVYRNTYSQKEYFPDTITPKKIRNSSDKKTFTFKKMQPLLNSNLKNNSIENSYIQSKIPKTSNDVMESNFTNSNNESFIIKTLSAEQLSQLESSRKLSYLENSEIKKNNVEIKKNKLEEKKKEIDDSYFPNDLDNSFKHHNLVLKNFKQNLKTKLSQIKEEQHSYISDDTYILKNNLDNEKQQEPKNSFESIKANIEKNNLFKKGNLFSKTNSFENYIKDYISISKNNKEFDKKEKYYKINKKNVNNQRILKKYKKDNLNKYNNVFTRKRSVKNRITKKKISIDNSINRDKLKKNSEFKIEKTNQNKKFLTKKFEIQNKTPFEMMRNLKFQKSNDKREQHIKNNFHEKLNKNEANKKFKPKFQKLIAKNNNYQTLNIESRKLTQNNENNKKFNKNSKKLTPKKNNNELFILKSNYDMIKNKKEFKNLEIESYLPLINNIETVVENRNGKETRTVTSIYYNNSEKKNSRNRTKNKIKNKSSNSKKTYNISNSKKRIENDQNYKSNSKNLNNSNFRNICSSVMTKDFKSPAKFVNKNGNFIIENQNLITTNNNLVKNENSNKKYQNYIVRNDNSINKKCYSLTRENQIPIKAYNSPIKIKNSLYLQRNLKHKNFFPKDDKKNIKSFSNDLKKKYSPIKKNFSNYKKDNKISGDNKNIIYRYFDKRNGNKKNLFSPSNGDLKSNIQNFKNIVKNSSFMKKDVNHLKKFSTSLKKISIKNNKKEVLKSLKKNSIHQIIFQRDNSTSNYSKLSRSRSNTPKSENFKNLEKSRKFQSIKKKDSNNYVKDKSPKLSEKMRDSKSFNLYGLNINQKTNSKISKRTITQNSSIRTISRSPVQRIYYNKTSNRSVFHNSNLKNLSPLSVKRNYNNNKNILSNQNSILKIRSPSTIREIYNNTNYSITNNSSIKNISKNPIKRIYKNKINKTLSKNSKGSYFEKNDNIGKSKLNYQNLKNICKKPFNLINNKYSSQNSEIKKSALLNKNYKNNINKPISQNSSFKTTSQNQIRKIYKKNVIKNYNYRNKKHVPSKNIYYDEKFEDRSINNNNIQENSNLIKNLGKNDLSYKKKITRITNSPYTLKKSQNLCKNNYYSHIKKKMVGKENFDNENYYYKENIKSENLLTGNNSLKYIEKENMIQKNLSKIFNSKKKEKCDNFFNDNVFSQTFENLVRKKKSKKNSEKNLNNPYETIFNKINNTDNISNFENLILREKKDFNNNQNSIINSNMPSYKNKERIQNKKEYCYYR